MYNICIVPGSIYLTLDIPCSVISLSSYLKYILVSLDNVFCMQTYSIYPNAQMYSIHTLCTPCADEERNSCSAPEEQWSDDVGDSQEYVESPFIPGSLVWAKLDRYPW